MTTRSKRRSRMNQRFAEERAQDRAELDDLRQRCETAQGDSSATVDVAKQLLSNRKADAEKQIADLTTRSQGLLATTEALKEELAAQKAEADKRAEEAEGALQGLKLVDVFLSHAEADKRAEEAEGALQGLKVEKAEADKRAEEAEGALQGLKVEKAEANKKVEEVQEALQRLTAQKAEADKRAEEAEGALEELQEEKANMEKQIARLEKEVESEKAERKRSENETSDMMKDLQKTRAVAFEKINKLETQLSLLRSQEDETSAYSVSPTVVLESPNGGRTSQAAAGVKKTVPSFITSSTPESPLAVTQDGTLDAIRRTSKKRKAVDSHEAPVPKLPESFPLSKKTKASTSMNGTAKWLENGEVGLKIVSAFKATCHIRVVVKPPGRLSADNQPIFLGAAVLPAQQTVKFILTDEQALEWLDKSPGARNSTLHIETDHDPRQWIVIRRLTRK